MTAARLAGFLAYPGVMAVGFLLFAGAQALGLGPAPAAYLAVLWGALWVTLHERLWPYRRTWQPDTADVACDGAYMLLVQILLPYVLALMLVLAGAWIVVATGGAPHGLWPHAWPVAVQVIVMMLAADFARYWLHRAMHALRPLWRLHAVHHVPDKLYWLNVGRFHPLEKALQYLLDAAPFVLLGVSPEVLSLYFVFYAINGFFQHSNCRVRLGWLNALVAGPELHRWHHAKPPQTCDVNFGNNLIVWDLLFGTRYLPRRRSVRRLGIAGWSVPTGFWQQMASPFLSRAKEA